MKFSLLAPLAVAGLAAAVTDQASSNARQQKNMMQMQRLMDLKLSSREKLRKDGFFDAGRFKSIKEPQPCVDGKAGEYGCSNIDLLSFLSHEDLGSKTREGNDIWGWSSDDGREFVAAGQTDGTAFAEVLKGGELKYLGRLPTQTEPSTWRDMKVIDGYVYIGSEAEGHGLQIFDMRKLAEVTEPVTFDISKDLTAWFDGFGSSHNIVAHEETKMIYAVGTARDTPCAGGLFMVDVSDPANPTSPGCVSEDGYVHDAQCVIYNGPDEQYLDREICFNYNEDALTIVDVTDKAKPVQISSTPYEGAAYTHQGWLANNENMEYLLLDDELDESDGTNPGEAGHTTTYIVNITSLATPSFTGFYQSPVKSIDHNQYVIDGLTYQANYGSGLRIVDVSSVSEDPTGKAFKEAAFFDCHPEDDAQGGVVEFVGTWSVYPYFKSGVIVLNSIERGLFALKHNAA
ncbi:hypothetical protein AJ79_07472 [Helicocarpus griseus UAMH5409]|uniref:Regulatory P domain-containing protein n=1 Tax=Helicocarpus griseus UAMH5409 TaxID=1447875 RepID=A0A2B7X2G8_9EURO|nr:hypothetical protein AJ79_07472 [Helicocarpus griseus UAMH5409]